MRPAPDGFCRALACAASGLRSHLSRRVAALLLVASLGGASVAAFAVVPLALAGALYLGATSELVTAVLASTVTIGSVIAFVNFTDTDTSSGTAPIHVQLASDAPLPTPSGWTAPSGSGSGGQPTPPSTASSTPIAKLYAYNGNHSSMSAACEAWRVDQPATVNGIPRNWTITNAADNGVQFWTSGVTQVGTCHYQYCTNTPTCSPASDTYPIYAGNSSGSTCPAGYTSSSGTCTLSNAALVPKPSDNRCGIKRVGNSFAADDRDPDCTSLPNGVTVGSGYVAYVDADGSSHVVTIDSGTSRAQVISDHNNGDGTTTRTTVNFGTGTDAGVPVTGLKQETFTGTGDLVNTSPIDGGVKCGGPGQPACRIDESGTPSGESALAGPVGELDSAAEGRESVIENQYTERKTDLPFSFSADSYLPDEGTCSPVSFGSTNKGGVWLTSWDWCDTLGTARSMWAWFFSMCCALYVWRSGTASFSGKK